MAHTHYHRGDECDPPKHHTSCTGHGPELSCTYKSSGSHSGENLCRHSTNAKVRKIVRKKPATKKTKASKRK